MTSMTEDEALHEVAGKLAEFYSDPYEYVMWNFPWGQKGTPLEKYFGPRKWQKAFLIKLGEEIKKRGFDGFNPVAAIQMAGRSGHGIGKSALTAMLIKFVMDTRPYAKGVITANTSQQLNTKTWAELGKWHSMSITKPLFTYTSTRGNMTYKNAQSPETWFCVAVTCREEESEAFAGQHNINSTSFYIFDEASAIPEKIFEVAQGGLTDGEPMIFCFGNPTRNTGFFHKIFGVLKHRWLCLQIDSRNVEGTNKELLNQWVNDYGEDSDFVRVRVKGMTPRTSVTQFIPTDLVEAAQNKKLDRGAYYFAPKILGVDVAWYGGDRSCIWLRQGLAATLLWQGREVDSIDLAGFISQFEDEHKTRATFIDAGMGNGVIDQLRRLGRNPTPVYFGGKSLSDKCLNKRAQMWDDVKEWLKLGPMLQKGQDILDDLISPEYHMTLKGQVQLESKEDMRKRGLSSPDLADGLALTFAFPVLQPTRVEEMQEIIDNEKNTPDTVRTDYDVLA